MLCFIFSAAPRDKIISLRKVEQSREWTPRTCLRSLLASQSDLQQLSYSHFSLTSGNFSHPAHQCSALKKSRPAVEPQQLCGEIIQA
ncbi:hypothetical protein MHYP_G00081610 [Metynnis hypsauchen]